MSRENVELARQGLAAYTRRDVPALMALTHPDVELDWSESRGFQAGVYHGFEAAMGFYRDYFEAFEEIVFEAERYIDAGEMVIVPNVAHQRGREGIEVTARSTLVFTVHDSLITRICLYQETAQALKAAGLQD
jgi:ketosteroid isomerase-like protein